MGEPGDRDSNPVHLEDALLPPDLFEPESFHQQREIDLKFPAWPRTSARRDTDPSVNEVLLPYKRRRPLLMVSIEPISDDFVDTSSTPNRRRTVLPVTQGALPATETPPGPPAFPAGNLVRLSLKQQLPRIRSVAPSLAWHSNPLIGLRRPGFRSVDPSRGKHGHHEPWSASEAISLPCVGSWAPRCATVHDSLCDLFLEASIKLCSMTASRIEHRGASPRGDASRASRAGGGRRVGWRQGTRRAAAPGSRARLRECCGATAQSFSPNAPHE